MVQLLVHNTRRIAGIKSSKKAKQANIEKGRSKARMHQVQLTFNHQLTSQLSNTNTGQWHGPQCNDNGAMLTTV